MENISQICTSTPCTKKTYCQKKGDSTPMIQGKGKVIAADAPPIQGAQALQVYNKKPTSVSILKAMQKRKATFPIIPDDLAQP